MRFNWVLRYYHLSEPFHLSISVTSFIARIHRFRQGKVTLIFTVHVLSSTEKVINFVFCFDVLFLRANLIVLCL